MAVNCSRSLARGHELAGCLRLRTALSSAFIIAGLRVLEAQSRGFLFTQELAWPPHRGTAFERQRMYVLFYRDDEGFCAYIPFRMDEQHLLGPTVRAVLLPFRVWVLSNLDALALRGNGPKPATPSSNDTEAYQSIHSVVGIIDRTKPSSGTLTRVIDNDSTPTASTRLP